MKKTISTNAFNSARPPHRPAVNRHIHRLHQYAAGSPTRINGRNSAPAIEKPWLPTNLEAGRDLNKSRLYSEVAVALQRAFSRGRGNTFQKHAIGVGKITLSTGEMAS